MACNGKNVCKKTRCINYWGKQQIAAAPQQSSKLLIMSQFDANNLWWALNMHSAHFLFALFIPPPSPLSLSRHATHFSIIYVNVLMLQLNGSHYGCCALSLAWPRVLLRVLWLLFRFCVDKWQILYIYHMADLFLVSWVLNLYKLHHLILNWIYKYINIVDIIYFFFKFYILYIILTELFS